MKSFLVLCLSLLVVAGCAQKTTPEKVVDVFEDEEVEILPEVIEEETTQEPIAEQSERRPGTLPSIYTHQGDLFDVTGSDGQGQAEFGWDEEQFFLDVTMENLPPLDDGFFYEGWLVRKDPFNFISTGPAEDEGDGHYSNVWLVEKDYADHLQYVLTLEPDDGDPAPAKHILEGDLKPIQ